MVCSLWSTIIFPIIPAILKYAVLIYYILVGVNLKNENKLNNAQNRDVLIYLKIYNFIAFLWTQFFISGVIQMTVAGTFTTWYWTFKKTEMPPLPLRAAFKTAIRYHLGTIALGSLTINIFLVPRLILSICSSKISCFRHCVSYLEKFLRQFDRIAYVMCARHGKPLCPSGSSAYELILPNFVHYFSLNLMADIFFGMSKLLLIIGTAVVVYFSFEEPDIHVYWFGIAAAYFIISSFFSVYSMAADALTLYFREHFFFCLFWWLASE